MMDGFVPKWARNITREQIDSAPDLLPIGHAEDFIVSERNDVTDEYLAVLWGGIHSDECDDCYAADVTVNDVPKLIREIWRLRTELAKAEGFNKGLMEGVEWLKRDNAAMRRMLSETN